MPSLPTTSSGLCGTEKAFQSDCAGPKRGQCQAVNSTVLGCPRRLEQIRSSASQEHVPQPAGSPSKVYRFNTMNGF
jgi:hypothetical protein